jgi:hypothetical protein
LAGAFFLAASFTGFLTAAALVVFLAAGFAAGFFAATFLTAGFFAAAGLAAVFFAAGFFDAVGFFAAGFLAAGFFAVVAILMLPFRWITRIGHVVSSKKLESIHIVTVFFY